MDWILDRLAIGNLADGKSDPDVDVVYNICEEEYNLQRAGKVRQYVIHDETHIEPEWIDDMLARIRAVLRSGRSVLVHCREGRSRAATIIVAHLYDCGMSLDSALAMVKKCHPIACPHPALWQSLELWVKIKEAEIS